MRGYPSSSGFIDSRYVTAEEVSSVLFLLGYFVADSVSARLGSHPPRLNCGNVYAPRRFPYIHIVRRGVNASAPARAYKVIPFRYDYGRGYTRKRACCASRHGLFMEYIARFLPPTRVLTPLLPCRSIPPLPRLLSPSSRFLRLFLSSTALRRLSAHATRSAKKERSGRTYFMPVVIGSLAGERFPAIRTLRPIEKKKRTRAAGRKK